MVRYVAVSEWPHGRFDTAMDKGLMYEGTSRDHDEIAREFGYTTFVSESKGVSDEGNAYHIRTYRSPRATLHVSVVGT